MEGFAFRKLVLERIAIRTSSNRYPRQIKPPSKGPSKQVISSVGFMREMYTL